MYYFFEPEVSGGLGGNSVVDTSVHPPIVSKLNYRFDGWLGDDILESFPCYVITESLKKKLESTALCGYQIDQVEVTKSDQFEDLYPGKKLPVFYWLKIIGEAGKDDFGVADDYRLVISDKALKVINDFNVAQADIEKY